MSDLGIILMAAANSGVLAYIGFSLKERSESKEDFRLPYLRLFFIGASVLNMLAGTILSLIITNAGSVSDGLEAYIFYIGFVFIIYMVGLIESIIFAKKRWRGVDND